MSLDNLFPVAGNNAIQNAAFAIEWAAELLPTEMQKINNAIEADLKSEFQNSIPQNVQKFSFVNEGVANPRFLPSIEIGGYLFEKRSPLSPVPTKSITLGKQNLVILINEYSRWEAVWEDVRKYISLVLNNLREQPINNIGLQYSDVFIWKDTPDSLNLNEVFRPNSQYLTPNVLNVKKLWHSHHGYIVDSSAPVPNTRLDNINVNLIDIEGTLSIQIVTSHRATLETPIWYKGEESLSVISEIMSVLHDENKLIMHDLLSDEICKKIKLEINT
jgi:uncharacterized protein (TIGR04255 family)